MPIYHVGHSWTDSEGVPYLRLIPGGIDNIDIAFYIADMITQETGMASGVYLLNTETLELELMQRPESTTPPEDMPRIRILPGNNPEGAPDVLTAPEGGVGGGVGGGMGQGIGGGRSENPEPGSEPDNNS